MDTTVLLAKRRLAIRRTPGIGHIMKGSIVIVKRYCGKTNCRCRKGRKHRSLYISRSVNGKQRLIYIPRRSEDIVRRLINNYRRLKITLEKISAINISLATIPKPKAAS